MTAVADREGEAVVEAWGGGGCLKMFERVGGGSSHPTPTRCRVTNDRRRLLRRG